MAYAEYSAEVVADSPIDRHEVDSGATPPFTGFKAKTYNGSSTRDALAALPTNSVWSAEFWSKSIARTNSAAIGWGVSLGTWPSNTIILVSGEQSPEATVRCYWNGTRVPQEQDSLIGSWHHIVFTSDGSALKLYIDGTLVQTGTSGPSFAGGYGWIGNSNDQWYLGDLSQVALYSTALSAARVLAHWDAANSSGATPISLAGATATRTRDTPAPDVSIAPPGPITLSAVAAVRTRNAPAPGVSSPPRVLSAVAALRTRGAPSPSLSGLQIKGPKHTVQIGVLTQRIDTTCETQTIETGITVPEMEYA